MIVFTFERNHPPGWISCGCTETSGAAVNADTCLCMYETRTRPWKSGWRSGKVDISSQSRETLTLDSLPQGDWNRGKKVMLHTLFPPQPRSWCVRASHSGSHGGDSTRKKKKHPVWTMTVFLSVLIDQHSWFEMETVKMPWCEDVRL